MHNIHPWFRSLQAFSFVNLIVRHKFAFYRPFEANREAMAEYRTGNAFTFATSK